MAMAMVVGWIIILALPPPPLLSRPMRRGRGGLPLYCRRGSGGMWQCCLVSVDGVRVFASRLQAIHYILSTCPINMPYKHASYHTSYHTPYQYVLPTYLIDTPNQPNISYQPTVSIHPINTHHQHTLTHPIKTPYQPTPSTYPINTPYQPTPSTYPINTPCRYTLSTQPRIHPTHPLDTPLLDPHLSI